MWVVGGRGRREFFEAGDGEKRCMICKGSGLEVMKEEKEI